MAAKVELLANKYDEETIIIEYDSLEDLEAKIKALNVEKETEEDILRSIRRVKRKKGFTKRELERRSLGMQAAYSRLSKLSYEDLLELEYLLSQQKQLKGANRDLAARHVWGTREYNKALAPLGALNKKIDKFYSKHNLEGVDHIWDILFAVDIKTIR